MKQNIILAVLIIAIILVFGYILQDAMGNPIGKKNTQQANPTQTQTMTEEKVKQGIQ